MSLPKFKKYVSEVISKIRK